MTKKRFFVFFTFLILGMLSCQSASDPNKEQEKAVLNDIMAVHDKVMPEMGKLNQMRQTLYIDAKRVTDARLKQTYIAAADSLETADEAMMDWMGQFKGSFEGMTHEQIMAYLNEQNVKVRAMQATFDKHLENAKNLIK